MSLDTARQISRQIDRIVHFYHPRAIDTHAGFYHYFTDDGHLYNPGRRHLVSSTGFVSLYARYAVHTGNPEYLAWARHGIRYLEDIHFQTRTHDYAWTLDYGQPSTEPHYAVGLACVITAYAEAARAGIGGASASLDRELARLDERYYEPRQGLYVDEINDRGRLGYYRSSNAQRRVVEALIAAYAVTFEANVLSRALDVVKTVWRRLAGVGEGWIWSHFDVNWGADFDYHRDELDDRFRPWGFQIGEQLGWARILTALSRHFPRESWLGDTGARLFAEALEVGWDFQHGGLIQSVNFDRTPLCRDKRYWVQAQGLAAAAELGSLTGQARYARAYARLADYTARHMIDPVHGGWYDRLTFDNRRYSHEKSPAPKVDQDALDACYTALALVTQREASTAISRLA